MRSRHSDHGQTYRAPNSPRRYAAWKRPCTRKDRHYRSKARGRLVQAIGSLAPAPASARLAPAWPNSAKINNVS